MHCLSPEVHLKSGAAGSVLGSHPAWHLAGTVVIMAVVGDVVVVVVVAVVVGQPTSSSLPSQSLKPSHFQEK